MREVLEIINELNEIDRVECLNWYSVQTIFDSLKIEISLQRQFHNVTISLDVYKIQNDLF